MTPREHARLARALIAACGGLAEASGACRVTLSVLSEYQSAAHPTRCMAADVISDLEIYCGQPIYSAAMAAQFREDQRNADDLQDLACDLTEATARLQHAIRLAVADGRISATELEEIAGAERQAETALGAVRGARRGVEKGR